MVMEAKAENEMNQSQLNSKQKRETRQKARENAHERHDCFGFSPDWSKNEHVFWLVRN